MPRYKLTIEYDGGGFHGWQSQADGSGVQDALAAAVEKFCGGRVTVHGAGRTDAGVHAMGQVAHLDLSRAVPADTLRDAVNFHLAPASAAVLEAVRVADDFEARFHAIRRLYVYRIVNRRAPLALERGRAWLVPRPLDATAMAAAARLLEGHHDFTTFRAAHCQARSPMKTLDRMTVTRNGSGIAIACQARSFLRTQVRSMAGSLKLVGEGVWSVARAGEALRARRRSACGPVAPAAGLCLERVDYPPPASRPPAPS